MQLKENITKNSLLNFKVKWNGRIKTEKRTIVNKAVIFFRFSLLVF